MCSTQFNACCLLIHDGHKQNYEIKYVDSKMIKHSPSLSINSNKTKEFHSIFLLNIKLIKLLILAFNCMFLSNTVKVLSIVNINLNDYLNFKPWSSEFLVCCIKQPELTVIKFSIKTFFAMILLTTIFIALSLNFGYIEAVSNNALKMMKSVSNVCMVKEGATKSDLSDILSLELPATRVAKCYSACLLENIVVIKNGMFHKTGLLAIGILAIDKNDTERLDIIKNIADKCDSINDPDRCELALKLEQCFEKVIGKSLKEFLNIDDVKELKILLD